ncbi:MAG: VWA domain-containing protein [Planctomycetia bacterium]|nr:VWA domain-containing protein [Planctomycetia bacterium]
MTDLSGRWVFGGDLSPAWAWISGGFLFLCVLLSVWRMRALWNDGPWRTTVVQVSLFLVLRLTVAAAMFVMFSGVSWRKFQVERPVLTVVGDDSLSMAVTDPRTFRSRWETLCEIWEQRPELSDHYQLRCVTLSSLTGGTESPESPGREMRVKTGTGAGVEDTGKVGNVTGATGVTTRSGSGDVFDRDRSPGLPQTPLGDALRSVILPESEESPVAVILMTDGIVTNGESLTRVAVRAHHAGVPLFFAGIGRESPVRDFGLSGLSVGDPVFPGESVGMDFQFSAAGFPEGRPTVPRLSVRLRREDTGETLAEQPVPQGNQASLHFSWRPPSAGDFPCVIELIRDPESVPGDSTSGETADFPDAQTTNNVLRTVIRVRDELIHVLMIQDQPSFEYRFLRNRLVRDSRVTFHSLLQSADTETPDQDPVLLKDFPSRERLMEYDVIILGDADPKTLPDGAVEAMMTFVRDSSRRRSILVIAGPRHWPQAWEQNPLATLLPVEMNGLRCVQETRRLQLTPTGAVHPMFAGLVRTPGEKPIPGLIPGTMDRETVSGTTTGLSSVPGVVGSLATIDWALSIGRLRAGAVTLADAVPIPGTSGEGAGNGKIAGFAENAEPLFRESRPVLAMHYVGMGQILFQGLDATWRWRTCRIPGTDENLHDRWWFGVIRYLARGRLPEPVPQATLTTDATSYHRGDTVNIRLRLTGREQLPPDPTHVTLGVLDPTGNAVRIRAARMVTSMTQIPEFHAEYRVPAGVPGVFRIRLLTPLTEPEYAHELPENDLPGNMRDGTGTDLSESGNTESAQNEAEPPVPGCEFSVVAMPGELEQLSPDVAAMESAAKISGGMFLPMERIAELWTLLPPGETIRIADESPGMLWNRWWILLLVFTAMSADFLVTSVLLRRT